MIIHKATIQVGLTPLRLPKGAVFLAVGIQGVNDDFVVWYSFEGTASAKGQFEDRKCILVCTGMPFDAKKLKYLGTAQIKDGESVFVGHVYTD